VLSGRDGQETIAQVTKNYQEPNQTVSRQRNILLIEDDLVVRQSIGQALMIENFRVVPVGNQREALHEFQTQPIDQPIDVVLLDLNPKEENAWETVRHLTALQPDLPVVAMTARFEQHHTTSSARAFDALMEKPLDLVLLMKTLNQLTSQPPEPSILSRNPNRLKNINGNQSVHNE
jgi:DNA-binding response OmpR family regulator